mgnify:CR=1 FL=1
MYVIRQLDSQTRANNVACQTSPGFALDIRTLAGTPARTRLQAHTPVHTHTHTLTRMHARPWAHAPAHVRMCARPHPDAPVHTGFGRCRLRRRQVPAESWSWGLVVVDLRPKLRILSPHRVVSDPKNGGQISYESG